MIATYMLCGFSTITSIGVCLGVLLPLAMERKNEVIDLVVNALVAGNFASFLTAAIAGKYFSHAASLRCSIKQSSGQNCTQIVDHRKLVKHLDTGF